MSKFAFVALSYSIGTISTAQAVPSISVTYDDRPVTQTSRATIQYTEFSPREVFVVARQGFSPGSEIRHLNTIEFPVIFRVSPRNHSFDFPVPNLTDTTRPHLVAFKVVATTPSGGLVHSPFYYLNPRLPNSQTVEIQSPGGTLFRVGVTCNGGPCEIGRYLLNNDFWVRNPSGTGEVVIQSISPTPDRQNGCNGFAINPRASLETQSFSAVAGSRSTLAYVAPPALNGGLRITASTDPVSLVLTKSPCSVPSTSYPMNDAAVISIVRNRPQAAEFRPGFAGGASKHIVNAAQVDFDRFPRLRFALTSAEPRADSIFTYRNVPLVGFSLVSGWENQFLIPMGGVYSPYGRDIAYDKFHAAVQLSYGDIATTIGKERLAAAFIQAGIDQYQGFIGGLRHEPVTHQLSLTLTTSIAGLMLGDQGMANIAKGQVTGELARMYRATSFNEYQVSWANDPASRYENLRRPSEWITHDFEQNNYRVCCHGPADRAGALAAQMFGLDNTNDYPEFREYIDYGQGRLPSENLTSWNDEAQASLNCPNRGSWIYSVANIGIGSLPGGGKAEFMNAIERAFRRSRSGN